MRKIYQDAWLGISFPEFTALDAEKIADIHFYERFYQELFRRYATYEELPADWRKGKVALADFILDSTDPKDRLLAIGCGNGYMEVLLSQTHRQVTAIDPSPGATRLLAHYPAVKLINGSFPECLQSDGQPPYDVAYLNAVDYCLAEDELAALLKQIYDYPIKTFILISVSVYHKYDLGRCVKDYLKEILKFFKVYHPGQFWG